MSLRARWYQAGGFLALAVVLLSASDVSPHARCGGRSGLQPYVCIDYGDPWAAPLFTVGLVSLAASAGLLWGLAGAWRPEHAATLRLLLLVALAGSALVVAAWSLGAPRLACAGTSGTALPDPPCWMAESPWQGWAYAGGGALLGGALTAAAGLAFLTARRA